ncbi:hypothetical protein SNE40_001702 [Patella caerulea]|uniref:EGF-like domain-containing protein n=1 Tax=Patella caerulea TaxID=87958 RepID=A0AAN8K529_PATCE
MCFIVRRAVYKLTIWQILDRRSQKASKYYNFIDKLQADKIPLNIILTKSIMKALLLFLLMLLIVTSVAPASGEEEEQNILAEIDISLSISSSQCDDIYCKNGGTCVKGICVCPDKTTGMYCEDKEVQPELILNPCDGVECFNGGQCVGEGVCSCTFGFGGANCNRRVCDVTECADRSGSCVTLRCTTDATNCGGNVCNTANNEVCIDDTCVDEGDVCDGINCVDRGEPCGEGFCINSLISPNLCVNETCRLIAECDADETTCSDSGGSCSDGVCLIPCSEDRTCSGFVCINGFCGFIKCGETFCYT